jgi:hypothetical protein
VRTDQSLHKKRGRRSPAPSDSLSVAFRLVLVVLATAGELSLDGFEPSPKPLDAVLAADARLDFRQGT